MIQSLILPFLDFSLYNNLVCPVLGMLAFLSKIRLSSVSELSKDENESLWIEICTVCQRNIFCGVIYRHPYNKLDTFMENMQLMIVKVHKEKKYCIIKGDFNIN